MAQRIIRALWGDLHGKELVKFSLLAAGIFFLIGSYWPLKTLKDSIFINLVGPLYLPQAKLASLALFFPLVLIYSKLVDIFSKEKMIYILVAFYSTIGLGLIYGLYHPVWGIQNTTSSPNRIVGWAFYLFVESYVSLMVSLYWSFINDITTPESAKKGYGLIIFGAQFGGVLFLLLGNYLSYDTTQYATSVPIVALISVLMFFMIAAVVFLLKKLVGDEHMEGYVTQKMEESAPAKVGFFDGLKVLVTRPYVSGIFILIFFQELITTLMGFQMSIIVKKTFTDPGMVNKFFFEFNLAIQVIACCFALIGTSFFQRRFGIKFCLIAFPMLIGISIASYVLYPSLSSIIFVMLIARALNYTLYQPAKEVLYIPTSKNIKYKAKAWIDMFGVRFAKATGSGISGFIGPVIGVVGATCFGLIAVWVGASTLIGNMYQKVTNSKKFID